MAPHPSYLALAMSEVKLDARHIGDKNTSRTEPVWTTSQGNALQCLALVFSAISVTSAVLAFYWFIKMRRSFRHDLIMLLIQSDMFKALWFMIYPIVVYTHGPVPNDSEFCQVSGFFLALGIEASDFAVLMIAIHSALYIFKPRHSGEGGLYPYRHLAYALYTVLPLLLAGLAFVNEDDSYVSEGTYCYLPVRPFWYRLALGWIPRYVIFLFILGIYASIYYYVRYKFHGFDKAGKKRQTANEDSNGSEIRASLPSRPTDLPTTPPLACHGLIAASRETSWNDADGKQVASPTPPVDADGKDNPHTAAHRFIWASLASKSNPAQAPVGPLDLSIGDADSFMGPSTPRPNPPYPSTAPASPRSPSPVASTLPSRSRATSWRDGFVQRLSPNESHNPAAKPSTADIFSILRRKPNGSTETPSQTSQLHLVNSRGQNMADAEMLRTRDKIRRQLRFLFIYPLVYIGMWVLPFVSHVLQYNDRYARDPPFGLACATTICFCSQAAIDCWLFSTREKPWRHIPGTDGGFWASLKFWSGWTGVRKRRDIRGPGKTRDEMVREARAAYQRRDRELAQRKNVAGVPGSIGEGNGRRGERSWWESPGHDGAADVEAMSPVPEELSNPIEDHIVRRDSRSIPGSDTTLNNSNSHFKEANPDEHKGKNEEGSNT